jgi:predicted phosphodiesterase
MKIQIFSDIHMEGYQKPDTLWRFIKPEADVAIVAGDIDARHFEATMTEIGSKFEKVFYVLGNHEFYRKDISWRPTPELMPSNVTLLDRTCEEYKGILFMGCTLWSDFDNQDWYVMDAAKRGINDFFCVTNSERRFSPAAACAIHTQDRAYLKMMLELSKDKKKVVVTHFLPSYECIHPKWKGRSTDTLNRYFSSNCDDLLEYGADLWVFGHTHDERAGILGNTKYVCNPLGYARENPDFKQVIIEV